MSQRETLGVNSAIRACYSDVEGGGDCVICPECQCTRATIDRVTVCFGLQETTTTKDKVVTKHLTPNDCRRARVSIQFFCPVCSRFSIEFSEDRNLTNARVRIDDRLLIEIEVEVDDD